LQILYREKIRDPEASWTKSRQLLNSEPRFASSELTMDLKEKVFRDHIKMLKDERLNDFKSLLNEIVAKEQITLTTEWEIAKEHIKKDPRFERINREERKDVYERFMRDQKRNAIQEFRQLLKECKNLGTITSKNSNIRTTV